MRLHEHQINEKNILTDDDDDDYMKFLLFSSLHGKYSPVICSYSGTSFLFFIEVSLEQSFFLLYQLKLTLTC
jgi:hypothetical protein